MQSVVAKLPGSGITSLTISDPIVRNTYDSNGNLLVEGCWEIDSVNTESVKISIDAICERRIEFVFHFCPIALNSPDP